MLGKRKRIRDADQTSGKEVRAIVSVYVKIRSCTAVLGSGGQSTTAQLFLTVIYTVFLIQWIA